VQDPAYYGQFNNRLMAEEEMGTQLIDLKKKRRRKGDAAH
jgi:hypothetical protein